MGNRDRGDVVSLAVGKMEGALIGHNSIAADRLRSLIERIERLEYEKRALADDIREVYAEAKGEGFDVKTMRQVVRLRKLDKADRDEQEALLDVYKSALGMLADTPLGRAAMRAVDKVAEIRDSAPVEIDEPEAVDDAPSDDGDPSEAVEPETAETPVDNAAEKDDLLDIPEHLRRTPDKEGRRACEDGIPEHANPYIVGTPEHGQWAKGWQAVAFDPAG